MKSLASSDPGRVGPYRTIAVLGSGAMGRVLLGREAHGDLVAIKLVHSSLVDDEGFRARFRREVKASRKVAGTYTATVLADDTEARTPWMASEFVAGLTLAEAVDAGGPFAADALFRLAEGLSAALADIHRAKLVHRDLKPSNIMLTHDGVKVIDFGIARAVDASTLTGTGTLVGSYAFMSPEQILADSAGPASDVFALGAVLGYAANGFGPFDATTVPAITHRIVNAEPRLGELSGPVRELVDSCLAKDPDRRPTPQKLRLLIPADSGGGADTAPWNPTVHSGIELQRAEIDRHVARTQTEATVIDPTSTRISEADARAETRVTPPVDPTRVDSPPDGTGQRAESGGEPREGDADGINAARYVRELARKLGVNLGMLTGTGPGGEITSQNVRDAATAAAADRAKAKARQDAARGRERDRQRAAKAAREKLKREKQDERLHEARNAARKSSAKSGGDSKSSTGPGPQRPPTPPKPASPKKTTAAKKKSDAENVWAVLGVIGLVIIGIFLINQDDDGDKDGSDSSSSDTSASTDYAGDQNTTGGFDYEDETTEEYVPPTTESVDESAGCDEAFDAISTYVDSANSSLNGGDNHGAAGSFATLASELRSAQSLAENVLVETNLGILADDTDKMSSALYADDNAGYDYWRGVWTGVRDDLWDSCYD